MISQFFTAKGLNGGIVLHGDYDVDGATSTAIAYLFLRAMGFKNISPFVSLREDGYGVTEKSIERIERESLGFKGAHVDDRLLLWMDHGVNSYHFAEIMLEKGWRILCLDHHVPNPESLSKWRLLMEKYGADRCFIYDPLLYKEESEDEGFLFSSLSAAGVVFSVFEAGAAKSLPGFASLASEKERIAIHEHDRKTFTVKTVINSCYKLAAISQAADCVPFAKRDPSDGKKVLTPAWSLAKRFEQIEEDMLPGIAVLAERTGTASRVPWVIGPLINASGRLANAYRAFELLVSTDYEQARDIVTELESIRANVREFTQSANINLEKDIRSSQGVAVCYNRTIPEGVVGIAASKGTDLFQAPCLYLTDAHDDKGNPTGVLKGSMRAGSTDFSCEEWILKLRKKNIIIAGGGHPAAAGLSLNSEKLPDLIADAEAQEYSRVLPDSFEGSVKDLLAYMEFMRPLLPTGKGHDFSRAKLFSRLKRVKPLKRHSDGGLFAFLLIFQDDTGEKIAIRQPLEIITPRMKEFLQKNSDIPMDEPASCEIVFEDKRKYQDDGRYDRINCSVAPFITLRHPDTSSGLITSLSIGEVNFTEGASKTSEIVWGSNPIESLMKNDSGEASFEWVTGRSQKTNENRTEPEKKETTTKNVALTQTVETEAGQSDVNDENKRLSTRDKRIVLVIDWVPEEKKGKKLSSEMFLLKRDSAADITALYGEEVANKLRNKHGGEWSFEFGAYIISHAVAKLLLNEEAQWYRVIITEEAEKKLRECQRRLEEVDAEKRDSSPFPIPFWKGKKSPKDYQYADVRLLAKRHVSLCGNDMGTGKTLVATAWAAIRIARCQFENGTLVYNGVPVEKGARLEKQGRVLIITKKALCHKFASEVSEDTFLNTSIVTSEDFPSQAKAARRSFFQEAYQRADCVIVTYDCLKLNDWIMSDFAWVGIVCDEAHTLKNPSSKVTRAIFSKDIDLSRFNGASLLAMTGTFAANRPGDWFVWVRLTNASPEYSGNSASVAYSRFKRRFDGESWREIWVRDKFGKPTRRMIAEKKKPENGEELRELIARFIVRRSSSENESLPPMNTTVHIAHSSGLYFYAASEVFRRNKLDKTKDLESVSNDRYDAILSEYDIVPELNNVESRSKQSITEAVSLKLNQVSSLDKAMVVEEILQNLGWLDKEPLVVMVQHRSALFESFKRLSSIGLKCMILSQEDDASEREKKVALFQNPEGGIDCFITTYGVGAEGLTLTKANRILLLGLPWTDGLIDQAKKRIHRIGQKREVEAVIVLLSGSVDHITWDLIRTKNKANFKTQSVDKLRPRETQLWEKTIDESVDKARKPKREKPAEKPKTKHEKAIEEDFEARVFSGDYEALKKAGMAK
jgi:single-stranded DNA-specific DHH superfamily exonuclease/SNF2 family DNA or RNA helicase